MRPARLEPWRKLVLASTSERRQTILRDAGLAYEAADPGDCETPPDGAAPEAEAERLALAKARAVAQRRAESDAPWLVVGADTIVVCGTAVLGKPVDRDDAARILRMLSATRHRVITGVALIWLPERIEERFSETTWVRMRAMTDGEIAEYVASGEADGKAGAYAIQETGDRFVESVEGSLHNVVGFPLERFLGIIGVGNAGGERRP